MADWTGDALANPRNLLPSEPADRARPRASSWLRSPGTRHARFSPDGTRLYFASDRGAGMLNVSIHSIDLTKNSARRRVTYDEGVAEGAVLAPDGEVLYTVTTRAREPAFLTMVTGPRSRHSSASWPCRPCTTSSRRRS